MKKKIDKIKSKKLYKNVVYVAVLMSVVLASLMSVLPLKRTIESSTDEGEIQKIFSVDNDTIGDEPKDEKKACEVISFIRQDEQEERCKEEKNTEKVHKEDEKEGKDEGEGKKEEAKGEKNVVEENKEIAKGEKDKGEGKKEDTKEEKSEGEGKKEDIKEEKAAGEGKNIEEKEVFLGDNKSCIVPLNGDIIKDFSGDKLVYFKPTDEWRIHKGIDIRAKVGTSVKAILDGYVDKIESDSRSGTTVVIKHSKREKSVYKNLASQDLVMPNQIIKQGDVIGVIGDVAGCGGDSHLHFEILKDDRAVNPQNYVQFNSK